MKFYDSKNDKDLDYWIAAVFRFVRKVGEPVESSWVGCPVVITPEMTGDDIRKAWNISKRKQMVPIKEARRRARRRVQEQQKVQKGKALWKDLQNKIGEFNSGVAQACCESR